MRDLGTIRVEVHHKWREDAEYVPYERPPSIDTVSEKLLKGKAITHTVK